MNLGIAGAGIANIITNAITLSLNMIYTFSISEIKKAIFCPDKRLFLNLCQYLKLGFPCTFMLCLNLWANLCIDIVAGYIGVTEQATQLVLFNIMVILATAGYGLDQAACPRRAGGVLPG